MRDSSNLDAVYWTTISICPSIFGFPGGNNAVPSSRPNDSVQDIKEDSREDDH